MADEPKNNATQGGDGRSPRRGGRRYFRRKGSDERSQPERTQGERSQGERSPAERNHPEKGSGEKGQSERPRAEAPSNKSRPSTSPPRERGGSQRASANHQRSPGGNQRAAAEARAQEEKRARRRRRRLRQRGGAADSKPETTIMVNDITDYVAPKSVFIYTAIVHADTSERFESRVEHFSQVGRTLEDYAIDLKSLFAEDGTIKNTKIKVNHEAFNFSDDDEKPEEKPS